MAAESQNEDIDEKTKTREDGDVLTWNCWLRTMSAASGPLMIFLFTGVAEAHSAVLLHQLKKKDSGIQITTEEESWIASLGILMAPVSALLGGPALDAFGRKKGLLFFFVSMGLGFGVIALAKEVYHVYIGRCICALSVGLEIAPIVYLAEICTKRQRSFFFSITAPAFSAGVIFTYLIGGYLPWEIASAIFSLGCFGYLIIQCLAPESPAWLYKNGQIDAATKSLQNLGRTPENIVQELALLKLSSKAETETFHFKAFIEPTVWKPFFVLFLFHFICNAAGVFDVLYYTVGFVEAFDITFDPLLFTVLISVARFLVNATVGIYFLVSVPRKVTTAVSAVFMAVSMLGVAVYEYLYRGAAVKPFQFLPVSLTLISTASSALGFNFLPWLIAGEMYPLQVRGAMTGVTFLVGTLFTFASLKVYGVFIEHFQIWGLLLRYAVFAFVGVIFGVFILPETQDKTLYEIEQGFLPKKKRLDQGR